MFWSLPTQGDEHYLGINQRRRKPTLEYLQQVAQAVDGLGYGGMLIGTGTNWGWIRLCCRAIPAWKRRTISPSWCSRSCRCEDRKRASPSPAAPMRSICPQSPRSPQGKRQRRWSVPEQRSVLRHRGCRLPSARGPNAPPRTPFENVAALAFLVVCVTVLNSYLPTLKK